MKGTLYGVGVGPGDPELMTLKAVRMIRENEIIAVPGADVKETVAYKIAVQAVPELEEKELLPIYMPMTHDAKELEENHAKGAKALEACLDQGKNVVFLTLGDPSAASRRGRRISHRAGKRNHFFLCCSCTTEHFSV